MNPQILFMSYAKSPKFKSLWGSQSKFKNKLKSVTSLSFAPGIEDEKGRSLMAAFGEYAN